ncbi:transcriptional activator RfaH [Ruegeria sediminis]|uniref:Transcriptional activator RfaH n=1 Tax=Ruegeria sediminis TaxID=2583820 RepID=A0ABY2X4K6_9RHOB|nr:transcription termination/antitermination NusG family protein [Ruegeria sediminis]TMV10346.1 transcriptional activator RfaH [Ruegeria sediminis]
MTFHGSGTSWHLAQLKPNSVRIADRNLRRQGFRTFLPKEDVTRPVKGKFVPVERLVFPGYIFVAFNKRLVDWRAINSTNGVTRLVSFGPEPATVPLYIVSQLMLRCDTAGKLLPPRLLKPGDRVRLTSGSFADFVAEIERIAPDRRVWVLLDIMGTQTRVATPPEQLRAI